MRPLGPPLLTRGSAIRLGALFGILAAAAIGALLVMIPMPGESHRGPLPALTAAQAELARELRADVEKLSREIGTRDFETPEALAAAAAHVRGRLESAGGTVVAEPFEAGGARFLNLVSELRGSARPAEIVVIGAHYDTCGNPGANDNGSGVAALLALHARFRAGPPPARTLRFVAFANEEPPFFQTEGMGSLVHARGCKARGERVVAMLSLETIGYYTDAPGSQRYPPPLSLMYPSTGNFIAFVGDVASRDLVRSVVGAFRSEVPFPSEGAALPAAIPGVGWSDHWAFWQVGYPALMATDTAPFRYPWYHDPEDRAERLDYERMARVVDGIGKVVRGLVGG